MYIYTYIYTYHSISYTIMQYTIIYQNIISYQHTCAEEFKAMVCAAGSDQGAELPRRARARAN